MADKKISQLTGATTPLAGTEVLPIVQSGSTVKVSIDNLTAGKTVKATTFDTDVAAAKVTLTGTTLAASGTDSNINVNITPKGTGVLNTSAVSASGAVTLSGGTANGVLYLNGSKVATSGSALVFDGSNLGLGVTPSAWVSYPAIQVKYASFWGDSTPFASMGANYYFDGSVYKYIANGVSTDYYQNAGAHVWRTAPSGTAGDAISFSTAMVLDASGNLGVNKNNPTFKLDVAGTLNILQLTSSTSICDLYQTTTAGTTIIRSDSNNIAFYAGGSQRVTFFSTGVVRFDAYGAGTLSTDANGNITASDGRYKTKTRAVENALDAIAALQPTYFRWNENSPFDSENEQLGFIAQEVAAVIPEASPGEDEDGKYRNYHDRAVIAMLVKAVQELKTKVADLESK